MPSGFIKLILSDGHHALFRASDIVAMNEAKIGDSDNPRFKSYFWIRGAGEEPFEAMADIHVIEREIEGCEKNPKPDFIDVISVCTGVHNIAVRHIIRYGWTTIPPSIHNVIPKDCRRKDNIYCAIWVVGKENPIFVYETPWVIESRINDGIDPV